MLVIEYLFEVSEREKWKERNYSGYKDLWGGQVAARFGSWVTTLRKVS